MLLSRSVPVTADSPGLCSCCMFLSPGRAAGDAQKICDMCWCCCKAGGRVTGRQEKGRKSFS